MKNLIRRRFYFIFRMEKRSTLLFEIFFQCPHDQIPEKIKCAQKFRQIREILTFSHRGVPKNYAAPCVTLFKNDSTQVNDGH